MYYQHEQRQTVSDSRGRSSPTPPPLPPLPSRELLDTVHASTNGLYREHSPSNRQIYSSTITFSKTVYDPDAVHQQEMVSASSPSSRLHASPRSTLEHRSTGLTNSPSLVGGNLSELDTLLDDLNTSTKMYSTSTMERRSAGRFAHSPSPRDTGLKPNTSTPVSSTLRSSSAQRELEIPKLSTLQRSTPSPHSLSPHLYDEADVGRSRLSPSFQTGSLHQQRPLVPASEQQFQQQSLMKVYEPVNSFPVASSVLPVVQNDVSSVLLSRDSAQQHGSLPRPQQQPLIHSYQEQQIITETRQLPANMTTVSYSAPQSTPSSLSSQPSSKSASGKQVRVLDASGRDVQVHTGFDGTDIPVRQERTVVQESSMSLQSQPASLAAAQERSTTDTNAYNDLENIMAEFDGAAQSSGSAVDSLYTQPMKVKSSESRGVSSVQSQNARSSSEHGVQILSPGVNGQDAQPSPSAYRQPVPQPTELGSSRVVMSDSQMAGRAGAMYGQLGGFDENGLPLVQKGDCGACGQPISGQVLMALQKIWHIEHFVCAYCKRQLGTDIFYENDGLPYCELDYQELFLPKCADCHAAIFDKCVTAFGKNFHQEHFRCAACDAPFGDDRYYEKDGKPYCSDDYFRMYAPKCGGCGKPIMSSFITAVRQNWHIDCFVCFECHLPFDGSGFYELNGAMYCERHFLAHHRLPCAACGQPIRGRCISAMYKKYHPEHFVCTFCLRPLNKGTFKEQNEKPYCHACFDKLFG